MKALIFDYKLRKLAIGRIFGIFGLKGFLSKFGPLKLKNVKMPNPKQSDWVVIKTHYCGICGSDTKQIFMDGNRDNPMTALISWPQILGHEVVGTIEKTNPLSNLKVGDRVVLNPWLSCKPRGIDPICNACLQGKNTLCRNFTKGSIARGIHTGNSKDATGGFAEFVPAHNSMAVKIPEGITWEEAVLADPFSVAFHSVLKVKPNEGSICAVYGCGTLGLLTVYILKRLFKKIRVIAIVRFPHQAKMAKQLEADIVIESKPTHKIVEKIAEICNCNVYYPCRKKPWLIEGVDYLFDTVASRETLEIGIRIVKAKSKSEIDDKSGSIVVTGVSTPKRFEWTPWYFKEITIIGSNAFAIEEFEGKKEHAYQHYFRFLKDKKINPTQIITHKFPLEHYKEALIATRDQKKYGAIKVLFGYNNEIENREN